MSDITFDVRVYPIEEPQGKTVAFASVSIDDAVAIRGVRIVQGEDDLFVSMPQSYNAKKDEYHDLAHPLGKGSSKRLTDAVLEEYAYQASLAPEQRGYENIPTEPLDMSDIDVSANVYPVQNRSGNTLAFANVRFSKDGENFAAINSARAIDSENGIFVSMPQYKDKEGAYHDVAFPLTADLRTKVVDAVLEGYDKALSASQRDNRRDNSERRSMSDRMRDGKQRAQQQSGQRQYQSAAAKRSPGIGE